MKYQKQNKTAKFFAGKGFYLVLALCIMAVGAAAWSAFSTISTIEENFTSLNSDFSSQEDLGTLSSVTEQVAKPVSDVEDTRPDSSSAPSSSEDKAESEPKSDSSTEQKQKVYFTMPLKGNVGKTFSDSALQYSETYGDMRLHLGVDILASKGETVVSAAAGTVTKIADDGTWGRMVVIDHGKGIVVYYCGLENLTVSEGEKVSAGTKMGVVGTVPCECEDESHIHITVTKDGEYISPLDLLAE